MTFGEFNVPVVWRSAKTVKGQNLSTEDGGWHVILLVNWSLRSDTRRGEVRRTGNGSEYLKEMRLRGGGWAATSGALGGKLRAKQGLNTLAVTTCMAWLNERLIKVFRVLLCLPAAAEHKQTQPGQFHSAALQNKSSLFITVTLIEIHLSDFCFSFFFQSNLFLQILLFQLFIKTFGSYIKTFSSLRNWEVRLHYSQNIFP